MNKTAVEEAMKTLMKGVGTVTLRIMSVFVSVINLMISAYADGIEELTPRIEKRCFPGHPGISRFYAHFFVWCEIVAGTVMTAVFLVGAYTWPKPRMEALINVSIAFFVGLIILSSIIGSIRKKGLFCTIIRISMVIFIIKAITMIFAWAVSLDLGVKTPELDNLMVAMAKVPDVIIIKFTNVFVPWMLENIRILFNN